MHVLFVGGPFGGKICVFPDDKDKFARQYHSFALVKIQGVTVKLAKQLPMRQVVAFRRFIALWDIDKPEGHRPGNILWDFRASNGEPKNVYDEWWVRYWNESA